MNHVLLRDFVPTVKSEGPLLFLNTNSVLYGRLASTAKTFIREKTSKTFWKFEVSYKGSYGQITKHLKKVKAKSQPQIQVNAF